MVLPEGALHVHALVPPSLAPEERTLWERNTYECGVCKCTQLCIVEERFYGLKYFKQGNLNRFKLSCSY